MKICEHAPPTVEGAGVYTEARKEMVLASPDMLTLLKLVLGL